MSNRSPFYNHFFRSSSFIDSVAWYEDASILMIYFNTGSVWFYYEVPFEVYTAFTAAPSLGQYFNANVRNEYPSHRLAYYADMKTLTYG